MDDNKAVVASLLVMWKSSTNADYDDSQEDAYQTFLLEKCSSLISFAPNVSQD